MVPKEPKGNASQRRIRLALTRIEDSQSAARHNRLVGPVDERWKCQAAETVQDVWSAVPQIALFN